MDTQADAKEGRDAVRANFAAALPMKRLGKPEELAAALFLASDESALIAGIDLVVDGGMTAA